LSVPTELFYQFLYTILNMPAYHSLGSRIYLQCE